MMEIVLTIMVLIYIKVSTFSNYSKLINITKLTNTIAFIYY